MKTQIEDIGIKFIVKNTPLIGWILLIRPVIYIIFSRKRDLNAYSSVDFTAIIFILYAIAALIFGVRSLSRSQTGLGYDILKKSPIAIFMIYSLYGIASMAWSITPSLTGFRAFECIATAILIIAVIDNLFESESPEYVILWSLLFCVWDILWSVLRTAQWTLDISNLLESSQMMATCFFYIAIYFTPRRWYNYLVIIMSIFSMSTVAYIGMGIGAISAFFQKGQVRTVAIFSGFILLLSVIAIGPYQILKHTIFFDKKEISIEETSGRNHLMDATIDCIERNPFGLGFFAAEPYVLYAKHLGAISAHNSIFSAGMGLGIPGMIIISIFFIAVGYCAFSLKIPWEYRPMLIGCYCVAFVHCMGNPSVGTRVFAAWIPCMYIFVLICAFYLYGKNKIFITE